MERTDPRCSAIRITRARCRDVSTLSRLTVAKEYPDLQIPGHGADQVIYHAEIDAKSRSNNPDLT